MEIRKATPEDLSGLMEMFSAVVRHMRGMKIYHWSDAYPNLEAVTQGLKDTWVAVSGEQIGGTICLNNIADPEYQEVAWRHPHETYLIVHRLAVNPDFQGKGIAQQLMTFAEDHARQLGRLSVRLDTYSLNPQALRFYEKLGYQKVGQFYFTTHPNPFTALEKRV